MNFKYLIPVACVLLSLALLSAAISPRFNERAYDLLQDSATNRQYFNSWARYHGRSYASHEFGFRYNVWRDNYAYVEHFNANANASFTLAINDLGDMTEDEVSRVYTGLVGEAPSVDRRDYEVAEEAAKRELEERAVPSSFDWRTQNAVTPVRSQGACGACYAFSSIGAIEGAVKIATGSLPALSDQMILDCAQGTGNIGCSGGNMEITYMWLLNNNGGAVSTQASYPYSEVQGTCKFSSSVRGAAIKSYRTVTSGSETDLLAKAAMGPVSVGINASPRSFAYYSSGTLDDSTCTSNGLNHAVLVVGWGTDSTGKDYWLIKNSWGTSWGQSGYAMIARNRGNMCGIATMASLPCYNSDCSTPTAASPSPAAPSPSSSPAARASASPSPAAPSPSNSPAARASASPSRAPAASPSNSPSACKCPCTCK